MNPLVDLTKKTGFKPSPKKAAFPTVSIVFVLEFNAFFLTSNLSANVKTLTQNLNHLNI